MANMDSSSRWHRDECFKMDRFKASLNPHFRLEANLKDPISFHALIQVCQAYDWQVKVMLSGVYPNVAALV